MRGPLDVARELLAIDVPYEIVHLPRRVESAHELPGVLGVPDGHCVVVEVFETDGTFVATIAPCDAVVLPLALARVVEAASVRRPELATVSRVTDYTATLASPIGLPPSLAVVADSRVATAEVLYASTGDSWTALKIRGADLVRATGAEVADLSEPVAFPKIAHRVRDTGRVPVALT